MDQSQSDQERLKELERKLSEKREVKEEKPHSAEGYSQAQLAWRMVTELVSGLGIGFGIGYGLDAWFETTPIMMIIFIFFGFAAGIKTVIRSAREVSNSDLQVKAAEQSALNDDR